MLYGDDETLFKSEGSSIPFRSGGYWNEAKVVDFKNNLKLNEKLTGIVRNMQKTVNCI